MVESEKHSLLIVFGVLVDGRCPATVVGVVDIEWGRGWVPQSGEGECGCYWCLFL